MTIKQAINILSSDTSFEAVKELQYYAGFDKDKVVEQIQEAMNMGAEALEKQIPKKVEDFMERTEEFGGFYKLDFMCPTCNEATICQPYRPKYCKHCGQKLDWGD